MIVLILVVVVISILKSPGVKGALGEIKVRSSLSVGSITGGEQKIFHNLVLPAPDGTTQIDHVVLSTRGIFVIETKNMTGWIFGGVRQKEWTQVLYKKKFKFKNPIHQNYKHVKALESFLEVDKSYIVSVVVFAGKSKFKNRMPDNVIPLWKLRSFIRSHVDGVLSDSEIQKFESLLNTTNLSSKARTKEHIKNIQANMHNPICARCGKEMVLRTAAKGTNRGGKFWGCSAYPACKGTRDIN
nr:NERD domain-containing protein [Alcanivorax sp. DP30]